VAEAFRALRTNIQYSSVDRPIETLLITSPSPQDGKSTVAANLGIVVAQTGREVVLIEGDLHQPKLHQLFGLPGHAGLSDLFVNSLDQLESTLVETAAPHLSLLPAGKLPPNPTELLDSERARRILEQIGRRAELTLIDSPPITAVADAAVLAPQVDGVLLVVRANSTKLQLARDALEQLERVGANVLGLVITGIKTRNTRYTYYYGYYSRERGEQPGVTLAEAGLEAKLPAAESWPAVTSAPSIKAWTFPGNGKHGQAAPAPISVAVMETPPAPVAVTHQRLIPIPEFAPRAYAPAPRQSEPSAAPGSALRPIRIAISITIGAICIFLGAGVVLAGTGTLGGNMAGGASLMMIGAGLIFAGLGWAANSPVETIGLTLIGIGTVVAGLVQLVVGVLSLQDPVASFGPLVIAAGIALVVFGGWVVGAALRRTTRRPR
jgi:capsular exopolysaccharide synthesis family protein